MARRKIKVPELRVVETPKPEVTEEFIRELLMQNDKAVGRALVALLARQTEDEQSTETTRHHNGVGFSALDAEFMTSLAKQFRNRGYLTDKQLACMRKPTGKNGKPRICKYARQLVEIANEKAKGQ